MAQVPVNACPCGLPSPSNSPLSMHLASSSGSKFSPLPGHLNNRRSRLSSVPLIELSAQLSEEEGSLSRTNSRRRSLTNPFPLSGLESLKGGMCSVSDTSESLHQPLPRGAPHYSSTIGSPGQHSYSGSGQGIRIKHLTRCQPEIGSSRFPKLDECAHFHYEHVELGPVKVSFLEEKKPECGSLASGVLKAISSASGSDTSDGIHYSPLQSGIGKENKENEVPSLSASGSIKGLNKGELGGMIFTIQITSNNRCWMIKRSYDNFCMLDRQLHRCVYDRKYSQLQELPRISFPYEVDSPIKSVHSDSNGEHDYMKEQLTSMLTDYLERFSQLAGSLINCGTVLNWFELDNRGNRLIVTDEAAINTPAVAAAYVVKRYRAQAADEISFEVEDMVSVIDMPPQEESTWWRGKKGFEVGFFPCECVEIIGDKVPHSIKVPNSSSSKPVLRKHGKLIAFFRSFLVTRPSRRKLKQSGILKERVFGCDLGELLMNKARDIPLVLKCCAEFIENHGIVDGIYRLSGVTSNIQKLRLAFDEDRSPDLEDEAILHDIHCVASLLKMYFRELPNPLLTYQLYDKFVMAVQSDDDVRLLRLRDVVQQLPPPHYRTLEYLIRHLARVAGHGQETGMTPKNVAIVWAPNLLRSKDLEGGGVGALHVVGVQAVLTEYLIRYYDLLFNEKMPIFPNPNIGLETPGRSRPKSLAISTPTKLLTLEEARSRVLCTNLPTSHQKYINVGGGPDSLPIKYHTVIDLPFGKRGGSTKHKKSPSGGWKSFFTRTGSRAGEKERTLSQRKKMISSPRKLVGLYPDPYLMQQHKDLCGLETPSQGHAKKLRTVKSAESLVLSSSSHSCHVSGSLDLSTPSDYSKLLSWPITFTDPEERNATMKSPSGLPSGDPSSLHKHVRSISHDSYFEQLEVDCNLEEDEERMEANREEEGGGSLYHQLYREVEEMIHNNADMKELSKCLCIGQKTEEDDRNMSSESCDKVGKSRRKQKFEHALDSDTASPKVQKLSSKPAPSDQREAEEIADLSSPKSESPKTMTSQMSFGENLFQTCSNEKIISVEVHDYSDDEPLLSTSAELKEPTSPMYLTRNDYKRLDSSFPDHSNRLERHYLESETPSRTYSPKPMEGTSLSSHYLLQENYFSGDGNYLSPSGIDTSLETPDSPTMANISEMPSSNSDSSESEGLSSDVQDEERICLVTSHTEGSDEDIAAILQCKRNSAESLIGQESINSTPIKDELTPSKFSDLLVESTGSGNVGPTTWSSRSTTSAEYNCFNLGDRVATEVTIVEEVKLIPSDLSSNLNRDIFLSGSNNGYQSLSRRRSCHERISPVSPFVDDSRRKFESEIGRSIVHDHQVRLEMEQIQAEGVQQQRTTSCYSSDTEVSEAKNGLLPSMPKLVELRRSPTSSIVESQNKTFYEAKRNSEPLYPAKANKAPVLISQANKRMSEPAVVTTASEQHNLKEKKSVKELLSKFETVADKLEDQLEISSFIDDEEEDNIFEQRLSSAQSTDSGAEQDKNPSEMREKPSLSFSEGDTKVRTKCTQPSLFTQLKVLKLQSLQSPRVEESPLKDPWSDPILDLLEKSDSQSRVEKSKPNTSPIGKSSISSAIKSTTSRSSFDTKPVSATKRPQTLNISKQKRQEAKSSKDRCSPPTERSSSRLNKGSPTSVALASEESSSPSTDDLSNKSLTPLEFSEETNFSQSVASIGGAEETESDRRERINRYKEERRAQLREKLRSESFRVEAEEKEKVQNEFRTRKGSTGTKGNDEKESPSSPQSDHPEYGSNLEESISRPRSMSPKKAVVANADTYSVRSRSSHHSQAENVIHASPKPKDVQTGTSKALPSDHSKTPLLNPSRNNQTKETKPKLYVGEKLKFNKSDSSPKGKNTSPKSPTSPISPSSSIKSRSETFGSISNKPIRIKDRAAMFECASTKNHEALRPRNIKD